MQGPEWIIHLDRLSQKASLRGDIDQRDAKKRDGVELCRELKEEYS